MLIGLQSFLHFGAVKELYTLLLILTLSYLCREFHTKRKQECNVYYIEYKTRDSKINLSKLKLTLSILLVPKSTNKPL